jgi:DNA-directed RNA polymerase subunit B
MIPFPDHDQGPRVTYQDNMGSQAVGETFTNTPYRWDAMAHWLWYAQTPTAITDAEKSLQWRPNGYNPVVALGEINGMTYEDAIIVARGAIERGMGRLTVFRTFSEAVRNAGADRETLGSPSEQRDPPVLNLQLGNDYRKLGPDGLPVIGTQIVQGDILIGKWVSVSVLRDSGRTETAFYDRSFAYNYPDPAVVDNVRLTAGSDGRTHVSIRVRFVRQPVVGDKLSSRHGQKGTIGAILDDEDMPFIAEGTMAGCRPDIVISPQAIGRMTIGQLMESAGGILACLTGDLLDASPFQSDMSGAELLRRLRAEGESDKVAMVDGRTGERFRATWNVGVPFYQSLKHMVHDKIRSRNEGPNTALTRQPREGKKQDGGLKIGNMEADVLKGHGAIRCLTGRLRDASDKYTIRICVQCGGTCEPERASLAEAVSMIESAESAAATLAASNILLCRNCQSRQVAKVKSRYASRLLISELKTIGIRMDLRVKKNA